jgi:hypothetical protein
MAYVGSFFRLKLFGTNFTCLLFEGEKRELSIYFVATSMDEFRKVAIFVSYQTPVLNKKKTFYSKSKSS